MSPLWHGGIPPYGYPLPPVSPLIYVILSVWGGIIPCITVLKILGKIVPPTHKWGGGKSFYPYICIMEWIRKYREKKLRKRQEHDRQVRVFTEIVYLRKRDKVGGNMEIHFPKHDPPSQLDPKS